MLPSYVWNYGGPADNIGFTPFAHTLVWEGNKYNTASIYYMLDKHEEYGWDQVDYWEYVTFNYEDSELLDAQLDFRARTRSNYIQEGFGVDTGSGSVGYWNHNFDKSLDDSFYQIALIKTNERDPVTETMDRIKIFLHNYHQKGRPVVKSIKGLIKIGTIKVPNHAALDSGNQVNYENTLQLIVSHSKEKKFK